MVKEEECCAAHLRPPLLLGREEAARLRAGAAPRPQPPPPPPPALVAWRQPEAAPAPSTNNHAKREEQRRTKKNLKAHARTLREAEAVALRSRDAIKQLDSAFAEAQVLRERETQVRLREQQRAQLRASEAAFDAEVVRRDDEHHLQREQQRRLEADAKLRLRHHLQQQMLEAEKRKRGQALEAERERRELEEKNEKEAAEASATAQEQRRRKTQLLQEGLHSVEAAVCERGRRREAERRETMLCDLHADFNFRLKKKLHAQKWSKTNETVSEKVGEAQRGRDARLDAWEAAVGHERREREARLVSEAEERWAARRRRATEHGLRQMEAAEERRRRDKETTAAEKAFDWRRQQLLAEEWGRLRQEQRRRQQASNRLAFRLQMEEAAESRRVEAAVEAAEELERRGRQEREDAQVLAHAQAALERCSVGGGPRHPLNRALHLFKQRRGLLPPGAQRASVRSHLRVGLDEDRIAEHPHHYIADQSE